MQIKQSLQGNWERKADVERTNSTKKNNGEKSWLGDKSDACRLEREEGSLETVRRTAQLLCGVETVAITMKIKIGRAEQSERARRRWRNWAAAGGRWQPRP